jgi:hypothetical protein
MADRIALKRSDSFSSNEANDAESTFSKWEQDDPVAETPPVVRPASPTQRPSSALPPSPSSHPTAHTLPTVTGSGPQPGASDSASTYCIQPLGETAPEGNAGISAIDDFCQDNKAGSNLLVAFTKIDNVLIEHNFGTDDMWDRLDSAAHPPVTTLKFDINPKLKEYGQPSFNDDIHNWRRFLCFLMFDSTLTKLDLSSQPIGSNPLDYVSRGLSKQTTLKVLDLNGDRNCPRDVDPRSSYSMGKLGAPIAEIIRGGSGLSTLLASWQSLDNEDAMLIAGALKKNKSLTTLVLAGNRIGDEGAAAIFNAIRKNKKSALVELDISGGSIDISAAKSLANFLKSNKSLVNIAIGTVLNPKSRKCIYDALLKNGSHVKLQFPSNFSPDGKFDSSRDLIIAHQHNRNIAAAGQPAAIGNTASSTSATTFTSNPKSNKGPG